MDSIFVKCDKCVEVYLFKRWNTKKMNQLANLKMPDPEDGEVPDIDSFSNQDSIPIDEEANVPDFSHEPQIRI